jgi:hypothetical protein
MFSNFRASRSGCVRERDGASFGWLVLAITVIVGVFGTVGEASAAWTDCCALASPGGDPVACCTEDLCNDPEYPAWATYRYTVVKGGTGICWKLDQACSCF